MAGLTTKQLKDYENYGYVSPIDVLTSTEASEIRKEIEVIENRWPNELNGIGNGKKILRPKTLGSMKRPKMHLEND